MDSQTTLGGVALLGGLAVLAGLRDSVIDPRRWEPASPPELKGPLAPNHELTDAPVVTEIDGPEDVTFDEQGRLYAGAADGRIYRTGEPVTAETANAPVELVAETDGRPLGMTFHDGRLLVAAEAAGLIAVDCDGATETLVDMVADRPIQYADDLHVAPDGTIYLTDATRHDLFQHELLELGDTGRLVSYDPETEASAVELTGLGFANGVAPGPEEQSLLVTETARYRVTRYWIAGARAGERERFCPNLPGFPDNVDALRDGTYAVAVPSLRAAVFDRLHQSPWLKRQLGKLPESALARLSGDRYGLVLRIDETGTVVESYHDPTGGHYFLTSATPRDGVLYLGTLKGDGVARYELPTA